MNPSRQQRQTVAVSVVLVLVLAWLAFQNISLGLERKYELDDFQYAHASWRIARGEVIYRDFFEHHLPLLHQLLSLVWRFLDDDPGHIAKLRLAMIPIFSLAVLAGAWLNRGRGRNVVLLTAVCMLSLPTLSSMATQLRPDILGAALYLAAIAALTLPRTRERWRAFLSGALAVAAVWATLKVAYYGLPLVAAVVADVLVLLKVRLGAARFAPADSTQDGGSRFLLLRPVSFLAGGIAVGGAILLFLLATGSFDEWFEWAIRFSFTHQYYYPEFPWLRNLDQLVWRSFWIFPPAAIGVVTTVRGLAAWSSSREDAGRPWDLPAARRADVLLLASLITAFFSFAWQTAPYLYSLIPFTLITAIFAGRGIAECFAWCRRPSMVARLGSLAGFAPVLLGLLLFFELSRAGVAFDKLRATGNHEQRATLDLLSRLTAADDPVFHVWGAQVSRPAVHYFYFQEAVTMIVQDERLQREMVPAMISSGATIYLHQELFPRLVPQLRRYLLERFLPYNEDIWIYGRGFGVSALGQVAGDFDAVRTDEYFVWPPQVVTEATLEIDGVAISSPVFRLDAGRHRVEAVGLDSIDVDQIFLVWLPADDRPFAPRPELLPPAVASASR